MGWVTSVFHSAQLKITWKAINLTVRHAPLCSPALDLANLAVLMSYCSILASNSLLFRSLLSLLNFSMVRISTFVPATHPILDRTCHLNLNDIVFTSSGFALLVKWANNIQLHANAFKIPIHCNTYNHAIFPVYTLLYYLQTFKINLSGLPLFLVNAVCSITLVPLSVVLTCSWLMSVVAASRLTCRNITFHSFQRGSCNQAFHSGVSLSVIKFFGGWRTASVVDYLQMPPALLRVPHRLSEHVYLPQTLINTYALVHILPLTLINNYLVICVICRYDNPLVIWF